MLIDDIVIVYHTVELQRDAIFKLEFDRAEDLFAALYVRDMHGEYVPRLFRKRHMHVLPPVSATAQSGDDLCQLDFIFHNAFDDYAGAERSLRKGFDVEAVRRGRKRKPFDRVVRNIHPCSMRHEKLRQWEPALEPAAFVR